MTQPSKPFYESTTFWVNAGSALVLGATWLVQHQGLLEAIGVSPDLVTVLMAVANIMLRFRTSQPMSIKRD